MFSCASSLWPYPAVVSHRLGGTLAPENTRAAFLKARAIGVQMVETDAMLTADGVLVLSHDEELGRVVRGEGKVSDLTREELRRLDAGSLFAPEFAGESMWLASEVLSFAARYGIALNLEIKPAAGFEQETAKAVCELIRAFPDKTFLRQSLLLSSFSVPSLEVAQREIPGIPRGLLLEEEPPDWLTTAKKLEVKTVHPNADFVQEDFVREAHGQGWGVMVYTVDEPDRARALFSLGADAVCTNRPDLLLALSC